MQMPEMKQPNNMNCIQICTLGQFGIILKNGDIYKTSSRANRLWNLFKFLLINNNKPITADTILDSLFYETDYADPTNAIQNMIYRLRKFLSIQSIFENGKDIILFSNGCYKTNFEEDVWIDFIELEKLFNKADRIKKENPVLAIEYFRNAFDIYGGELLPELIYESWVITKRTYYRSLYLRIIENLSQLYAAQKSYDAIVEICQKAETIEPYAEEIHVLLMENLIRIGKIREAKEHYEKTVSVFEKEFGIQQTAEMQRIAQLLKSEYVPIKTGNKNISRYLNEESKAFFCDYRDFYTICILEKRRCERSGNAFCPVCLKFDNEKNIFKSKTYKNSAIKALKETLLNGLRKGDMVSLINESEFMVLLSNTEYQVVKLVMDRIINQFHVNDAYKDIILEMEVIPSLPKPKGI